MLALLNILTILLLFTLFLIRSLQHQSRTTTLLKAQITSLQTKLQIEREDGLDLNMQIKHKCAELVAFTTQVASLSSAVQTFKEQHELLTSENNLLVHTVSTQNADLEAKDAEITALNSVLTTLYSLREQETSAWQSNISGTIRALQGRNDELNATILTLNNNYRKLQYNNDVLDERNKALGKANQDVANQNGILRVENEELKEHKEEMGEMVRDLLGVLDTIGESLAEGEEWVGVEDLVDEALAESW